MKLIIKHNHVAALALVMFISLFAVPIAWAGSATFLRFPDHSIGRYALIRPAADPVKDEFFKRDTPAVGAITVPAGFLLSLTLNYNGSQNTKIIREFPPTIIRDLTCKDLEIGDKSVADLCSQQDLRALNLQGVDLTDEGIKSLGHLTKLYRLNICDTLVTEKGLAVLRNMPGLGNLNLSRLTLGDGVVERLQPLKNLYLLDLTGTQLKDRAVMRLPRFDRLQTLVLRRNNITDKCIDSLRKYKSLTTLDVTDTWITADGLKKLRGLPMLRTITIRGSSLKSGEKTRLKQELRGVTIQDGSREKVIDPKLFAPLH
jgi:hypothetical protein